MERGQVLAIPGSITPHTVLRSGLRPHQRRRWRPLLLNGLPSQFYFRTTDVTGEIKLAQGVEMIMPGDNAAFVSKLSYPIAMEKGLRFAS